MNFRVYAKNIFGKSLRDYKKNKKFLTALSFLCIILIFVPVLLENVLLPRAVSILILLPGWIFLYLCVYSAFFAAKGVDLSITKCVPPFTTVLKSAGVSFVGFFVFALPFMTYFMASGRGDFSLAVMIIYLVLSVFLILFSSWMTFLCFYGILDGKPLSSVFLHGCKFLKKNLFKLFALLFIVVLIFMAADMTIIGLFFVFPYTLIVFANIYLQFDDAE